MKLSLRPLLSLSSLTLITIAVVTAGCSAASRASEPGAEPVDGIENPLRTSYGDLRTTLEGPDLDRWESVRASLVAGFDHICGDTICSGDYANLATVRVACSSTTIARKLEDCVWVMGGSLAHVDPTSGAVTSSPRTFECHVPVAGNARRLLDTLEAAGANALHTPLPGTGASFYDALVTCFAGVHAPPAPSPSPSPSPIAFLELSDILAEQDETTRAAWTTSKEQLAASFDDVCGDTFCEGDYPDIAALGLACAVDRDAGKVTHCDWSFAAAEVSVGPRGRLAAHAATKHCEVAIDAPTPAFLAALGGGDPLHAALPGKATSIYDALVGCL
jgi:hypothetical protein